MLNDFQWYLICYIDLYYVCVDSELVTLSPFSFIIYSYNFAKGSHLECVHALNCQLVTLSYVIPFYCLVVACTIDNFLPFLCFVSAI